MDNNALKARSYGFIRTILGKDFITPEEIAETYGLSYSGELLRHLAETIPSEKVLRWCGNNDFMLVAGPPNPLSLLEVRNIHPKLFYSEAGGWYIEQEEKFSCKDKVVSGWLMLRKTPVPGSTSKTWNEQRGLLTKEEYVPNTPEMVWGITRYKEVSNAYLLSNIYARTSSVNSDNNHVIIGGFDSGGLKISNRWDDGRRNRVGVSSARKKD